MNDAEQIALIVSDTWDGKLEGEILLEAIAFELDHCLSIVVDFERDQDLIADIIEHYNKLKQE